MAGYVKQVTVFDEDTGEVRAELVTRGSPNGKGWCIMYTDKINDLVLKCKSAATLRVFMLLAANQQFEERGYISTKKAIQEKLGIDKSTCLEAFKWLKENFVVNECKVNGYTEFMVNPAYVTIGRDKKKREKEWLRRWAGQTVGVLPAPDVRVSEKKKIKSVIKEGRSIEC